MHHRLEPGSVDSGTPEALGKIRSSCVEGIAGSKGVPRSERGCTSKGASAAGSDSPPAVSTATPAAKAESTRLGREGDANEHECGNRSGQDFLDREVHGGVS